MVTQPEFVLAVMKAYQVEQGFWFMSQWKMPDYYCLEARDHYLVFQLRFTNLICRKPGISLATGHALELANTREADIFNIVEGDLDALEIF